MVFEFEYFWAILLLFIMDRICCLQEQFDKDFSLLPNSHGSNDSLNSNLEDFASQDDNLKLSFLRLYRLMHITTLLTLVYFCNTCFWFIMIKREPSRAIKYKFRLSLPQLNA